MTDFPVDVDEDDGMADHDCPGCQGGDKVPANADYWRCPVCDAEWYEEDEG
jgi:ribosomal protein L37AE/L43A